MAAQRCQPRMCPQSCGVNPLLAICCSRLGRAGPRRRSRSNHHPSSDQRSGACHLRWRCDAGPPESPLHAMASLMGSSSPELGAAAGASNARLQWQFASVRFGHMHDDYSWYASSELAALSTTPGGYRTFQMPPKGGQSNSDHRSAGGKGRGKSGASATIIAGRVAAATIAAANTASHYRRPPVYECENTRLIVPTSTRSTREIKNFPKAPVPLFFCFSSRIYECESKSET
jgi:hypothetical protein